MRKPTFCICENKDADQLRGNREADQRLCFRYIDSTIPLLSKSEIFKPLSIFCSCTTWFVSDLVGNQNVGFLMTRLNSFSTHLCIEPLNPPEAPDPYIESHECSWDSIYGSCASA